MLLNDGAAARQCHSSGGGARHRDGGAGMHRGQLRVKRLARRRVAGVNQVRPHGAHAVALYIELVDLWRVAPLLLPHPFCRITLILSRIRLRRGLMPAGDSAGGRGSGCRRARL